MPTGLLTEWSGLFVRVPPGPTVSPASPLGQKYLDFPSSGGKNTPVQRGVLCFTRFGEFLHF